MLWFPLLCEHITRLPQAKQKAQLPQLTHRNTQELRVHRLPERQRLRVLPIQGFQSRHESLAQLFRFEDCKKWSTQLMQITPQI